MLSIRDTTVKDDPYRVDPNDIYILKVWASVFGYSGGFMLLAAILSIQGPSPAAVFFGLGNVLLQAALICLVVAVVSALGTLFYLAKIGLNRIGVREAAPGTPERFKKAKIAFLLAYAGLGLFAAFIMPLFE